MLTQSAKEDIRHMVVNNRKTREEMETTWAKPLALHCNCTPEEVLAYAEEVGYTNDRQEDPEVVALRRVHEQQRARRTRAYREWNHEDD